MTPVTVPIAWASLALVALCAAPAWGEDPAPMTRLLSALAYGKSTAAAETLFVVGRPALPTVIDQLDSPEPFTGLLGANQLQSTYVVESVLSGDAPPGADDQGAEPQVAPVTRPTVGEAATYLLRAILLDDLYHQPSARLTSSDGPQLREANLVSRLSALQARLNEWEPAHLDSAAFDSLLQEVGLAFEE